MLLSILSETVYLLCRFRNVNEVQVGAFQWPQSHLWCIFEQNLFEYNGKVFTKLNLFPQEKVFRL
jgi:hypothetical protein